MRLSIKIFAAFMAAAIIIGVGTYSGQAEPLTGKAPAFSLKDVNGKTYDLSTMKDHQMIILYFFSVDSRPSQEGLLNLSQLSAKYKNSDLKVICITRSPGEKVKQFIQTAGTVFPVLLDKSNVSDLYQARLILPTVCIIGPEFKVLDFFQGGGKTTEIMLSRLAERKLQQKQIMIAKAISEKVIIKHPDNIKAKMVKGYAELNEGDLENAKKTFQELSRKKQGEVSGKEGLAAVYAKKGQLKKALELASEAEQKDSDRAYVHLIKGDILYKQNKIKEAGAEYRKATQKNKADDYQKAMAYNKLGRFQSKLGNYKIARELYDQAVNIDPYYIEATSNKGMTYEKEGKWDQALNAYQKAIKLDKNDTFAVVLAKKAQEMLELQKNIAQKKRIDKLVKDLVNRYRSQKNIRFKSKDTWTSRPMILSFIDFQEKGGLAQRDGFSTVLTTQLTDLLNSSGRVQVVERILIEQLLEELNLGTSELADKETTLKLGRVLAAKLIGTGSFLFAQDEAFINLRLIDTETSAIPKIIVKPFNTVKSFDKTAYQLNREILKAIILKYPLQGYVAQVTDDQVIINIGSKQGVVLSTKFDVMEEQKPIKFKGKLLRRSPKNVARIEVVQVEPDLSIARILNRERPLMENDMIKEKIDDLVARGGANES